MSQVACCFGWHSRSLRLLPSLAVAVPMASCHILLFLLSLSVAEAGILDGVQNGDMADFFSKGFNSVKDLFPTSFQDLDKNVNRVKDLLVTIKEKAKMLEPMASDAQKQTLAKVDSFLAQVTGFQQQAVQGGQQKFEENKGKWQQMVSNMFEKQGLGDLMKLVTRSSTQVSLVAATVVPVLLALYR